MSLRICMYTVAIRNRNDFNGFGGIVKCIKIDLRISITNISRYIFHMDIMANFSFANINSHLK